MPKKNNKIDATFELIDDYDKKKQFFEDTILKLKQFNPPINLMQKLQELVYVCAILALRTKNSIRIRLALTSNKNIDWHYN